MLLLGFWCELAWGGGKLAVVWDAGSGGLGCFFLSVLSVLSLFWACYVMMMGFRGKNNLLQWVFATRNLVLLGIGRKKCRVSVAG